MININEMIVKFERYSRRWVVIRWVKRTIKSQTMEWVPLKV